MSDYNKDVAKFKKLLRSCIVLEEWQLEDIAKCFIKEGWTCNSDSME